MGLEHARELATGTTLLDYYVVESKLGEGGMGVVYLVRNTTTGVSYAVKRSKLTDARARDSFLAELQTWIDLPPHPHIVTCRFFRTQDQDITIFSDYCEGGSLSAWIAGGKLRSLTQILDIAIQFAWGLHAAHLCGLVHQDVKPGNVLMISDGIAKVSDFGLSRATPTTASDAPLVASAGMMTRAYASPEQASGAGLSRHTDVWSWGVSLLEMIIGEVLWHSGVAVASSLDSLTDESDENPVLAERLKPEIVAILRRCFEPVPHERWNSLKEAADALIRIYEQETGSTYPRVLPIALPRSERRSRGDAWDVEQLVRDVLAAVGRKENISEFDAAASPTGMAVGRIRLMEIALKWLEQPEQEDRLAWLLFRTRCLRAKASFHFDANDIHGCDQCLRDAISCITAASDLHTDVEVLRTLANAHLERSLHLQDANASEHAAEPARAAINIAQEQIRRSSSGDVEWTEFLARAITAEANAVSRSNDSRAALARYDDAIRILELLPASAQNRNSLAINLQNKGNLLCKLGRPTDGIDALNRALHVREALCAEDGGSNFREDLGYSLYNLAKAELEAGQIERAALISERLVQIRSEIADRNLDDDAKLRLANALSLKAHILDLACDTKGALESAVDAVLMTLTLVVEHGRNDITPQLGAHLNVFGMIFGKLGFGRRDNDSALVDIVGKLFAHSAVNAFDGDPEFACCLSDYAMALVRLKRFTEAELYLDKILASDKKRYGVVSQEAAMTLHNLGACHFQAKSLAQAERYCTEAATMFRTCEAKQGYYAGSIGLLAEIYSKSGREDEALEMFRRVIGMVQSEHGFEQELIAALIGMASLLGQRGCMDEAVDALKTAHATVCRTDGRESLEGGRVADRLCLLLARCGRSVEAVPWFEEALERAEVHFGLESEAVSEIRKDFGRLLLDAGAQAQSHGDSANAEHCFARATCMAQALTDDVMEATAMTNLGLMQRKNGKREQAVRTLEHALALNQRVLGPEHPNTLMCLSLYGVALVYAGLPVEALKCFEKGLMLAEHACGKDSQEARAFRQNYQQCLADLHKSRNAGS